MANEQNLKPFDKRTESEQREIARKGGIASGEARREKRDLRKAIETLLEKGFKDKHGNDITGAEAVSTKLFEQALNGNIRAFETIRDTVGQKPVEKIMVADINQDIIDEVEKMVLENE